MENLFESLNQQDSVFFLLSVLVAFLIGFVAAWAMWGSRASRLSREVADWKKKYDDQGLELASLREKLDLSTADLAKAKREAESAIEQALSTQNEKMKWQKDLDQSLEETVRLQAACHSYEATIDDLNRQLLDLKQHNEMLAGQVADGKSMDTQAAYGASLEQVGSLEAKISQLSAENETLREGLKKEDENLLALLKSYNDSTNRLGTLEQRLGNLMAENEALQAEMAALKAEPAEPNLGITIAQPIATTINPADKEAITSGSISPSDAKNEVLAAIGTSIPSATADQKDDLTQIKGIGSFLEKKLNALGIRTYGQLSHFDANFIDKLTTAIEFFPGRIERDDWVGQAKALASIKEQLGNPDGPSSPGNLKVVEGIGPKIEKLLHEAGILSLQDLANASSERLKEILLAASERYRLHDPGTWAEQARLALNGDLGKLKDYQKFLAGGKEPS